MLKSNPDLAVLSKPKVVLSDEDVEKLRKMQHFSYETMLKCYRKIKKFGPLTRQHTLANGTARGKATIPPNTRQRPRGPVRSCPAMWAGVSCWLLASHVPSYRENAPEIHPMPCQVTVTKALTVFEKKSSEIVDWPATHVQENILQRNATHRSILPCRIKRLRPEKASFAAPVARGARSRVQSPWHAVPGI